MNEVIQAMIQRRSIRKFKADAVPDGLLSRIVEAGLYAASGMGRQSSIIAVVTEKTLRDRLMEMNCAIGREKGFEWTKGFDPFYGAPAILIVLAKKEVSTRVYDGSLVMGNLMLAAHSLGLGSIWIHRAKEEFETPQGQAFLKAMGISGEWEGIGHCAVGYMDGELPPPPPRNEGRVFWAKG